MSSSHQFAWPFGEGHHHVACCALTYHPAFAAVMLAGASDGAAALEVWYHKLHALAHMPTQTNAHLSVQTRLPPC